MLNLFLIPVLAASILSLIITISIDTSDNDDVNTIKTGLISVLYATAIVVAMLLNLVRLLTAVL